MENVNLNIIGISGKARSGKSTSAKIVESLLVEYGYSNYALAEPIKKMVSALFGWDERHIDGELKEMEINCIITKESILEFSKLWVSYKLSETYDLNFKDELVKILDIFGAVSYRNGVFTCTISPRRAFQLFGTEYGRNLVDEDIWVNLIPEKSILSDVRFENEAKVVRSNGKLFFIEKNNMETIDNSEHSSENGVKFVSGDHIVLNNGTIGELEDSIKNILKIEGLIN